MLHYIIQSLKEVLHILLMVEVISMVLRFMVFGRIRGKHRVLRMSCRILTRLCKFSFKLAKTGSKQLYAQYVEYKKVKEQPSQDAPSNVIPFRKRA